MKPDLAITAAGTTAAALIALVIATAAVAAPLEARKDEKERLAECEESLCRVLLDKGPTKGRLRCDIDKYWGKSDIDKGAKSKKMDWGFGDARCGLKLALKRSEIIEAITAKEYEYNLRQQNVQCEVGSGDKVEPLTVRLAPKMKFENGKVKKVWLKLKKVDGPPVLSSLIWSAAVLEDSIGIFHKDMVNQINKFIHDKCEKNYGKTAERRANKKERQKEARAANKKSARDRKTAAKTKPGDPK